MASIDHNSRERRADDQSQREDQYQADKDFHGSRSQVGCQFCGDIWFERNFAVIVTRFVGRDFSVRDGGLRLFNPKLS